MRQPLVLKAAEATPEEALADLRSLPASNASRFVLEDFAQRHMHVRDELAWKASRGLPLTERERATLYALDAVLDSLDEPSAPLSQEVQDLLRDFKRA